jgi:hypothetical protein
VASAQNVTARTANNWPGAIKSWIGPLGYRRAHGSLLRPKQPFPFFFDPRGVLVDAHGSDEGIALFSLGGECRKASSSAMGHFLADMMTEAEVEKTRARLQLVPGCPCVAGSIPGVSGVGSHARRDVKLYALPIGSGARALGQFGHL